MVKSDLAGGRLSSGLFSANAAWWAIAVLAYNLVAAMRRLVLGGPWLNRRMKALRFALIGIAGWVATRSRRLIIRLTLGHPSYALLLMARSRIRLLATGPPAG